MELKILKIDLDMKSKVSAILHLQERLAYFHDIKFFYADNIKSIDLIKKASYGARIVLNSHLPTEKDVVLFQLLLGSDYKKEVNTLLNHFKFKMDYSNRLFTSKRYKNGEIKTAKIIDVTRQIKEYLLQGDRGKNYN